MDRPCQNFINPQNKIVLAQRSYLAISSSLTLDIIHQQQDMKSEEISTSC